MYKKPVTTFYPLDDFGNKNIPIGIAGTSVIGTIAGRSGTELYTYYQIYDKCFRVGFWIDDAPKELTLDQLLKEIEDNPKKNDHKETKNNSKKIEIEDNQEERIAEIL